MLADLRTPYIFKRYEDVKRDTYFIMRRKSTFGANGQPQGKKLLVEQKQKSSQVAYLNTVTKEEEAYLRLESRAIRPPTGSDPLYPERETFAEPEVLGFKADPGVFDYPSRNWTPQRPLRMRHYFGVLVWMRLLLVPSTSRTSSCLMVGSTPGIA